MLHNHPSSIDQEANAFETILRGISQSVVDVDVDFDFDVIAFAFAFRKLTSIAYL